MDLARIRSNILYKRKVKEIGVTQKQVRRLHIAPPIINQENDNLKQEENESENESIYEEDFNVSDSEYDNIEEETEEETEEAAEEIFNWSEICENWINLSNRENQFDHEEDNHLMEMAYQFNAAGRDIHPADDETAKWSLEYLFKEDFKAPTFLGTEFNFSDLN